MLAATVLNLRVESSRFRTAVGLVFEEEYEPLRLRALSMEAWTSGRA
jgi:hypothetical protein